MAKDVQLSDPFVAPGFVPILSPGKHRRPSQGACFMEFASYLAGERWSDHPACTHPLLAFLARGVNDFTSDDGRQELASLVPSVIGLASDDPLLDVTIALRAARVALPVASETRQRALASGVIACERMLRLTGGDVAADPARLIREASEAAPSAWSWAQRFSTGLGERKPSQTFTRQGRAIISTAILGAAQACVDNPDAVLAAMLRGAIDDTVAFVGTASAAHPFSTSLPEPYMVAQV